MGLATSFSLVVTHDHGRRRHRHWLRIDGSLSAPFNIEGPPPPDLRPGQVVVRTVPANKQPPRR
jgi:hypothetical protein